MADKKLSDLPRCPVDLPKITKEEPFNNHPEYDPEYDDKTYFIPFDSHGEEESILMPDGSRVSLRKHNAYVEKMRMLLGKPKTKPDSVWWIKAQIEAGMQSGKETRTIFDYRIAEHIVKKLRNDGYVVTFKSYERPKTREHVHKTIVSWKIRNQSIDTQSKSKK